MSVNDQRGPSIDSLTAKPVKTSKGGAPTERLAHRGCNTRKGAVTAVVPWPDRFVIADPATIITSVDRLARKGGREVMGRCVSAADAQEAADWLVDRLSRLRPDLAMTTEVERGGGQFLLVLRAG